MKVKYRIISAKCLGTFGDYFRYGKETKVKIVFLKFWNQIVTLVVTAIKIYSQFLILCLYMSSSPLSHLVIP